MSVVLVTGGTGTFGSYAVPLLRERGYEVRVLSRGVGGTHRGDLATGESVAEAAAGAELVLHAASAARERWGEADPQMTRNLLAAAPDARHFLYVSIVGIDRIPFRYYRHKLECERVLEGSERPHTIFRATQFHELLEFALRRAERWPVAPLPLDWRFQAVAAEEAAARAVELLEGEPLGRAPDFGGPEVLGVRRIVEIWRGARGRPRAVVNARWPGRVYRGFRDGLHTTPEHAEGRRTWSEHVAALGDG